MAGGGCRVPTSPARSRASALIAERRSPDRLAQPIGRVLTGRQRHYRADVAARQTDVAQHAIVPFEEFGDRTAILHGTPESGDGDKAGHRQFEEFFAGRRRPFCRAIRRDHDSLLRAVCTRSVGSGRGRAIHFGLGKMVQTH